MTQKSSGIGPPGTQAGAVCDRARHRNPLISVRMYIPLGESQKNISVGMYITHSQSKEYVFVLMYIPHCQSRENVSVRMYITHSQSKEYVPVLMYIPHTQSRENVSVRTYIPHNFMCRLMCERCNYDTRSALVNYLLLSTTSHTI